ncbi:amino acid permease [Kistimonas asteriae]|uniref:amino acid permease n=1 Tax=Kistimonas asteriae TaxID=517724 RepID=UPI001BAD0C4E|nr:amino acid permease [Kistimonas asteriae]
MGGSEKKLTLLPLTVIVTGNMMGSGIFLLPSSLAALGSVSLLGWLLTAGGAIIMAMVFARLGFLMPRAGGMYAYTRAGIGNFAGFQVVYGYWFAIWGGNTAIALAGVGYLAHFFPVLAQPLPACVMAVCVIWLLTILNTRQIRLIGKFQTVTTTCMLIPVVATALLGWFWFDGSVLMAASNTSGHSTLATITAAASLTLWSFLGLESACVLAGRAEKPERDVPIATVVGTSLAAALYILSTTVLMGIVPAAELAQSTAPFSLVASHILGDWAGGLVSVLAIIACFGCLNGWILMQGQIAKAAADDYLFPRLFSRVNRHNAPVHGLIVTAILMSLLLLLTLSPTLNRQYETIALMAVLLTLVTYIYTLLSALVVMEKEGLRTTYGRRTTLLSFLGVAYCFWAVIGAGETVLFYGGIALLSSAVVYAAMRRWHIRQGISIKPE